MRALSDRMTERSINVMWSVIGAVFFAAVIVVAIDRPLAVLATLLGLIGAVLLIRFPVLGLVVFLFLEPFQTAIYTAFRTRANFTSDLIVYWTDALIIGLFVRAVAERWLRERRESGALFGIFGDRADVVMLIYVAAFIGIAIASPSRTTVAPALSRYVEGPLLFLTILFLRPTRRELWRCAGAMLAAATVIGVAAVIERFGPQIDFQNWYGATVSKQGSGLFQSASGGYRSGSFLNSPLVLGFYLAGSAPLAAALSSVRSRWRFLARLSFVACGAGLVTTITRSGYLGGGIGVLVVLLLTVKNPGIKLAAVGLTVVIASSAAIYYVGQGSETFVRSESNEAHGSALRRDFDLMAAKPFGYGLGTTDHFAQVPGNARGQVGVTESTYFATALEAGVQGLLAYLVALFITGLRVRGARIRSKLVRDPDGNALAAGAIGTMLGIAISGVFLGIHELVVEVPLWGAPAIAIAWSLWRSDPAVTHPVPAPASLAPVA
jgi:O-antigen ligase/polysaccharide polymerase Wzy-like membrane protein